MSGSDDLNDVDEKPSAEVLQESLQKYCSEVIDDIKPSLETLHIDQFQDEMCGNKNDTEEHITPPCFDASKLKETVGHKIVEQELDFEEEEVHDEKDDPPPAPKEVEADEEDGVVDEKDDDHEEGEADEGEISDEDDLEEGEVKDGSSNRKTQPRPICRFFNKGQCTWGTSCRFIHPGVNDKGNYNMFAPNKPHFGANMMLPGPPPPMMMMMMGPGHNYGPRMGMRGPEIPVPPAAEELPPVESAWERGLRHAKEILKKASRRKEQEPDFEEKRMNLSIESNDKGAPDFDKENDYYGRSPPFRHSESFSYGRYDEPAEIFENSDRESREVWRSGRYENFEVRWPRQEFESRDRSEKERPRYRRSYEREKYEHRSHDDDRLREDVPTRGDEWRDPWRRSKTPKGRSHSRGRSRRSYSSASSRSFSTRSSRSSYSYSRSSSSKSSFYSSDSYSKSRSRSPFSRLGSPSPTNHPRNYDRMRQETRRGRRAPFPSRSPIRGGRSPPLRSPHSPPSRVPRSPPQRPTRSPPMRLVRSPPLRTPRSPPLRAQRSPVRVIRHKMSPDTTKQIPLPPTPVPSQQSAPPVKETPVEKPSETRLVTKAETRSRLPRSYSGSESSRSISRSVSRSSSSASRSRSRSRSVSRSGSYSRSISMSSVSSASGSESSSDSDAKKASRSPSVKEVPVTKPAKSLDVNRNTKPEPKVVTKKVAEPAANQIVEAERSKVLSPKTLDVVFPREKRISMVLPKQLHSAPINTGSQPAVTPMPKVSKDLLRQSGQKPQIKLTLLSKAPPPPSALDQTPTPKEVVKQKPVERVEANVGVKKDAGVPVSRKRPLSPPPVVKIPAPPPNKRSTTSRREELLKQLKAVEDAIARKRAKI